MTKKEFQRILRDHAKFLRTLEMDDHRKEGKKAEFIGMDMEALGNLEFSGVDLRHAIFRDADLTGMDMSDSLFDFADFSGATLNRTIFHNSDLRNASFRNAEMISANLESITAVQAQFYRANLDGALFGKANLQYVDFKIASLQNANFAEADVRNAYFDNADLTNAFLPDVGNMLLATWGVLSDKLTRQCMHYDAANHANPASFDDWARGGLCPYTNSRVRRAINFRENKVLWTTPKKRVHSGYNLLMKILKEKRKGIE